METENKSSANTQHPTPSLAQYKQFNFNSEYEAKGYPEKFWPILNEYFSRYNNEFVSSEQELMIKKSQVFANLNSIELLKASKGSWYGCYFGQEKRIEINPVTKKLPEITLINTIFHELNHAGENMNSPFSTSFQQYNPSTSHWEGIAMNEIITEMKSSRLAQSHNHLTQQQGDSKHLLNLSCYGDLIFAGSMFHSALGISEKEFLVSSGQGRQSFDNEMASKFPSPEDYRTFVNGIIFNTDALHALKYNRDRSIAYSQDDIENMQSYTDGIYNHCLLAMDKVIPYQAFMNRNSTDMTEYLKKCRFYLNKLNANYRRGATQYTHGQDIDVSQNTLLQNVQEKIVVLEAIEKQKSSMGDFAYSDLLSQLMGTNTDNKEHIMQLAQRYGITLNLDDTPFQQIEDQEFDRQILTSDYGNYIYNNSSCMQHIKELKKKESRLSTFFKKIFPGKHNTLPPAPHIDNVSKSQLLDELNTKVIEDLDYSDFTNIKNEKVLKKDDEHII